MKIIPRITPAAISSFALLLMMVCADFAYAVRDLIVASGNRILRFDGQYGTAKGVFIAAGAGGLTSPTQMILGSDGKLYIADSGANVVKRFDLDGNFIDNFTLAGPLTNPVALRFGPDGTLYVLCGGSARQIHRFHATTGIHEGMVVNATSTQLNSANDFILMPSTNDFLITSATNAVARFNFSTGAFVSNYLNPTRSTGILNSPTGITIGPDGNYWVASSLGTNKITRFNINTATRIDDAFLGASLTNGHHEIKYNDGYLYVANGSDNNIVAYDCFDYLNQFAPPVKTGPSPSPFSTGDGFEFVSAGSQGLSNPKNLLFVDINDPPIADAGIDRFSSPGQIVTVGGWSYDPEGLPVTCQWTQLSGTPVLFGSLLTSGSVTSASLGFIAPDANGPMVFQLTASDGVKSTSDTVVVAISGPPVGSSPVLDLQQATGVTTQSATLHGSVNPGTGNVAYRFEYGTVSLNSATVTQTVNGSQAVSSTLTGLLPGQT